MSKGHNSLKNVGKMSFFFSAHHLIKVYIYTKFHENILKAIRVVDRTRKVNGQTDRQTDGWRA